MPMSAPHSENPGYAYAWRGLIFHVWMTGNVRGVEFSRDYIQGEMSGGFVWEKFSRG